MITNELQFGIPSLDILFDLDVQAAWAEGNRDTTLDLDPTSITIIGPDGTGKSLLSLHLASTYAATATEGPQHARVLYVSTDLKFKKAKKVWDNFQLGIPGKRQIPFEHASDREVRSQKNLPVELRELTPELSGDSLLVEFLEDDDKSKGTVGFVDLASHSAGDDWGAVNRILAVLQRGISESRHLIVIDSVAGFETLVGTLDGFGEASSRRARVARIMRSASEDCHVVFIVEEAKEQEHLPEEYVTDVVIRVRRVQVKEHTRRTIKIEKARARSHSSDEHSFEIRDRRGSTTGMQQNHDDPSSTNSYVHIFPSLAHLNFITTREKTDRPPNRFSRFAGFGIEFLDNMLASDPEINPEETNVDKRGLPCGSVAST